MTKKIDIREVHMRFEHLIIERDQLIKIDASDSKINDLDDKLMEIIIDGIYSGIAFSDPMHSWAPISEEMIYNLENDYSIDSDDGKITINKALSLKKEKEIKFKKVQNLSMFACTILLFIYYIIIGWWV